MAGRPTSLTPEVERQVVRAIRKGVYDWVAAQAAGISRRTFYEWMRRGKRGGKRDAQFAAFRAKVEQARAEARAGAEEWVRREMPLQWLRLGPGREREGAPGWTQAVEAVEAREGEAEQKPRKRWPGGLAVRMQSVGWGMGRRKPGGTKKMKDEG
jgi:hypothetical protein